MVLVRIHHNPKINIKFKTLSPPLTKTRKPRAGLYCCLLLFITDEKKKLYIFSTTTNTKEQIMKKPRQHDNTTRRDQRQSQQASRVGDLGEEERGESRGTEFKFKKYHHLLVVASSFLFF
jgi:hypothetical protein